MNRVNYLNIKSFFLSLSDLLDIAESNLAKHQLRTAYIAWQIGEKYGLDTIELNDLIIASLIHDIGALSLEEKIRIHSNEFENIELHSLRGWHIVNKISGFEKVAEIIKNHHTEYSLLKNDAILAQIVNLSDKIERLINRNEEILTQRKRITAELRKDVGLVFHPEIFEIYKKLSKLNWFWFDLENPSLKEIMYKSPLSEKRISSHLNEELSYFIRDIVDFKTSFTVAHSTSVMIASKFIAKKLKVHEKDIYSIELAGILHDVGKLIVPNSVLLKPDHLTLEERNILKRNVYYTYFFLRNAEYSKKVCELASFRHENLSLAEYEEEDGIDIGARIISLCDMFVTLTEDRIYRESLDRERIKRLMNNFAKNNVDKEIINLLFLNFDLIFVEIDKVKEKLQKEYNEMMELSLEGVEEEANKI